MDILINLKSYVFGLKTEGSYPGGGLVVVKLFSLKKKVSPRVCGRRSFCKLPGFPRNHNSRKKFHHYQQLFSVSDWAFLNFCKEILSIKSENYVLALANQTTYKQMHVRKKLTLHFFQNWRNLCNMLRSGFWNNHI